MADIHVLPGIERRDLCGERIPATEVLVAAIDSGVTDVTIVATGRDGQPYIASDCPDMDRVAGRLVRAVNWLTSAIPASEDVV
jgi:hypothetical protein